VPGNHEIAKYDDDKKRLSIHWRPQFALPEDGPAGLEETCYTLVYHNLRIIGLNSNTEIDRQAAWLDDVLAKNSSPWVVCTFHHPVFSTAKDRDNPKVRAAWKPVLDKYRVDLVLQGHDHTYGRTGLDTPSADVETVANVPTGVNKIDAQTGTVYVVSVSGPKMYNLDRKDFMKRAAEDTQLYQIIHIDGGTLRYEARTAIGEVYDAFVLKKRPGQINELIEETPATPERRRSPAPAAAAKPGRTRVSFQQGIDGYRGTVDTELWEVAPTKVLEKQGTMTSDANNGGGESQILLRYEKIFGTDPGQIPPRSRIVSARLTVVAFDPGNTVFLHRVLVPWSGSSTWNSMSAGLSSDDLEATRLRDGFTFGDIVMDKQQVDFDVAGAIQSWANGAPNHGWVFINTGSNGWDFYSSDWHETDLRPSLVVEFEAPSQGGAAKNEQAAKEPAEKGPSTK
jgi:hypothetical protein